MAKVKSSGLRNYVGKLGGSVYYVSNGQNIARELAASVKNPRSVAQMRQRAVLKNSVAFFRANQFWMYGSAFESKSKTWSDYNAFVSANTGIDPVFMTKDQTAMGGGLILPYVVTKGSLPAVNTTYNASYNGFLTDIYTGDISAIDGSTTVAEVSSQLLVSNNRMALGDQISVIANYCRIDPATGTPTILARAYEVILDLEDTSSFESKMPLVTIGASSDGNVLAVAHEQGALMAVAVIISRGKTGAVKVSTQSMVLDPQLAAFNQAYMTATAFQAYSLSYGESASEDFLATGYSGLQSIDAGLAIQVNSITSNLFAGGVAIPGTQVKIIDTETSPIGQMMTVILSGIPDIDPTLEPLATVELTFYGTDTSLLLEDVTVTANLLPVYIDQVDEAIWAQIRDKYVKDVDVSWVRSEAEDITVFVTASYPEPHSGDADPGDVGD